MVYLGKKLGAAGQSILLSGGADQRPEKWISWAGGEERWGGISGKKVGGPGPPSPMGLCSSSQV